MLRCIRAVCLVRFGDGSIPSQFIYILFYVSSHAPFKRCNMPGIKRYFPSIYLPNSGKRLKYVASRGNNLSDYVPSRVTRLRRRGTKKYRRSFASVRRYRGRRSGRTRRGLTVAKVLRSLTPRHSVSYASAGKVQVGSSTAVGPSCVYYFPNQRNTLSDYTNTTGTVGTNARIINGSSITQVFPNFLDMSTIGSRISTIDGNSTYTSSTFFSPSVKFWAGDYKVSTKMVNQSNGQAIVHIYTCVARRDIPNSQNSFYNIMANGLREKLSSNDSTLTYAYAGGEDDYMRDDTLSPYDSSKFCSYFKVISRKIVMNAGDIKLCYLNKRGMSIINPAVYSSLASNTATWNTGTTDVICRKGAVFQFFKVTGQPTNDTTSRQFLGLTSPNIIFTHDYSFSYRFNVEAGAVNTRFPATGYANVGTGSIMGEQSDVAAPSTNA